MDWNKEADWLPMSNALAQVVFWKDDLRKAENFLRMIEGMGVPSGNFMHGIAVQDVEVSKRGLAEAQAKLKETIDRIK